MVKVNFNGVVANAQNTFDNPPRGTEMAQVRTGFFVNYPPDLEKRDGEVPATVPAVRRTINSAGGLVIAHLADISTLPGALHPSGEFLNPLTSQSPEHAKLWLQITIGRQGMKQPWASLYTAFDDFNGKQLDREVEQREALLALDGEAALTDVVSPENTLLAPFLEDAKREDKQMKKLKLPFRFTVDQQVDSLRDSLNVWAFCPNQPSGAVGLPIDRRYGAHVDSLRNARDIVSEMGLLVQPVETTVDFIDGTRGTTSIINHTPEEAQKLVDIFHR